MKKMMGFVLLGMLIILFAACGGGGSSSNDNGSNSTTTTTVNSTSTSTFSSTSTSVSGTTTTTVSGNAKATGVDISWVATTPTHPGVFCTLTEYITATMVISDTDGDTSVEWTWYDKADGGTYMPVANGSADVTEANGTVTTQLTEHFGYHHWIKFVATVDGVASTPQYLEHQIV